MISYLFVALLAAGADSPKEDAELLARLRQDYAQRYLEPRPHLVLAKYHHDRGRRLLAFFVVEHARRRFTREERVEGGQPRESPEAKEFHQSFDEVFHGEKPLENGPEAESALKKKLSEKGESARGLAELADLYISRSDWVRAEECLRKAMRLEPQEFEYVDVLAEVFRRKGAEEEAERLLEKFAQDHPGTRGAYQVKIQSLQQSDPAGAEKLLVEALAKFPGEPGLHFNLGAVLQNQDRLDEAEKHFLKAAELGPDIDHVQGWVGRFFLKVRNDGNKALYYYLNAYFLDPDFYDSEYAEFRIRSLSDEAAVKKVAALRQAGKAAADCLAADDPLVCGHVLEWMAEEWNPKHREALLGLMAHDDDGLRWHATEILMQKIDPEFEPELKKLLSDPDLRRRGLAAYLAMSLWRAEAIKVLEPWLGEPAQLLRYDAISALLQSGGPEGRRIALAHRQREKQPYLKRLLEAAEKN